MVNSDVLPPNDELFTISARLTIMIILCNHRKVGFTELQKLLHLTAGNLNFHIEKLKKANYVKTHKSLATGRPKTVIELTELGEASFKEYIYKFRHILNQV